MIPKPFDAGEMPRMGLLAGPGAWMSQWAMTAWSTVSHRCHPVLSLAVGRGLPLSVLFTSGMAHAMPSLWHGKTKGRGCEHPSQLPS